MPLLSRAEGHRIVGPHFGPLFDAINGSWTEYMEEYSAKQRAKHCTTTRAGIVHDIMVYNATKYFVGVTGSRVLDLSGLKLFTLEEEDKQIALRLKKFDEQLRSRNQQTSQVKAFRSQRQIDFIGVAYHLEAGYVLDRDQTRIEQISVVCPNGLENFWDVQLTANIAITKVRDIFDAEEVDETVNIVRPKPTADREQKPANGEDKN